MSLRSRIRQVADELSDANEPVSAGPIARRLVPGLSAKEREEIVLVGMRVIVSGALTRHRISTAAARERGWKQASINSNLLGSLA